MKKEVTRQLHTVGKFYERSALKNKRRGPNPKGGDTEFWIIELVEQKGPERKKPIVETNNQDVEMWKYGLCGKLQLLQKLELYSKAMESHWRFFQQKKVWTH